MMLIFIVVVFIICHSIRSIINTYECIQLAIYGQLKHWPDWIQTLVHVNHFALVVNSSINILIYCVKDEKFRNVMWKTLGLTRYASHVKLPHIIVLDCITPSCVCVLYGLLECRILECNLFSIYDTI